MDNREIILQTALRLFCSRGYDAVGVQEIVEQAGVTKPTLYHYFGSKQGLLEEILRVNTAELVQKLREAVQVQGSVSEVLFQVAKAYFSYADSHRHFYLFMLSQFYAGRETEGYRCVSPLIHAYYQLVLGIFERASGELGNMNGRQEQFAVSFIGILDSHMVLHQRGEGHEMSKLTDEKIYEIVRQFLYGIFS